MGPDTDAGAMMRAAFIGVAFAIRAGLDALRTQGIHFSTLRLAGGGSVHQAWQQLLMDALQVPLEAVACPNASARGAAILGGMATGHWLEADLHTLAPDCHASVSYTHLDVYKRQHLCRRRFAVLHDGWQGAGSSHFAHDE